MLIHPPLWIPNRTRRRRTHVGFCPKFLVFSVTTMTHEPLHLTWLNFARTCILTKFQVILKGPNYKAFVYFWCVCYCGDRVAVLDSIVSFANNFCRKNLGQSYLAWTFVYVVVARQVSIAQITCSSNYVNITLYKILYLWYSLGPKSNAELQITNMIDRHKCTKH